VDYDKFSLVKQLIRNRATIVWCTRLARAENADVEKRIEVRQQRTCDDALHGYMMQLIAEPLHLSS
jgi:N-terminal helicase PWI domain